MKNKFLIALLLVWCGCKKPGRKLPYYDTPDFTPRWELPDDKAFHKIRPFALLDQNGEKFTEKNLQGKICVVDFFFTTCPGICPKMTGSMAGLQKEFLADDRVLLLSHSVTPEKDTPVVLRQYAEARKVDYGKWRLLTGSKKEIYDLGRRYYFIEEDEGVKSDDGVFLHTENFVLIDKDRRIRGIYNGLDQSSIRQLVADIRTLETE